MNEQVMIQEDITGDINDVFEALVAESESNTPQEISGGIAEHVNVEEEYERLTAETFENNAPTLVSINPFNEASVDSNTSEGASTPTPHVDIPIVNITYIPKNKVSSTLEDAHSRFSGATWFNEISTKNISIVGQGGIGSWASLIVARLGVGSIDTYDDDIVETANMAGQMYGRQDIGIPKVTAVYNHIENLCGYFSFYSHKERVSPNRYCNLRAITISALDNMQARKDVFKIWWEFHHGNSTALFIDGRLSADELQLFCFRGNDYDKVAIYKDKWLFDQSEGEQTQCSFKQTTYMATMIASLIGNLLVNHTANLANPDNMFDLPFFVNYNAEMMYFKTSEV